MALTHAGADTPTPIPEAKAEAVSVSEPRFVMLCDRAAPIADVSCGVTAEDTTAEPAGESGPTAGDCDACA